MLSGMGIPCPESFFIEVCFDEGVSNWNFEITEFSVFVLGAVCLLSVKSRGADA